MKRKISKKIMAMMILSVLVMGVCNVNVAKAQNSISFTPVSSIKLGEKLQGKFQYQNASSGMEMCLGISAEDSQKFWAVGSGGPIPESPANGTVDLVWSQTDLGTTCMDMAINVGEITAKCYTSYDDLYAKNTPIATYKVNIEKPVISANVKEVCYVGDEVDFITTLTNTALREGNIEAIKSSVTPNDLFTYQAKTEIIEGMDLVDSTNVDYSNALKSQEKLTFKSEGTVKIKVTYEPVRLGGYYFDGVWDDEDYKDLSEAIYKPETILTIKVAEAKKTLEQEVTNVKSEELVEEKYTEETWKAFSTALEKAESVLKKENATKEEYVAAIEELKVTKENLKTVEDNSSTNDTTNNTTNNSATNSSAQNNKKEEVSKAPQTGDSVNALFYIMLCVASLICIVGLKKKTA